MHPIPVIICSSSCTANKLLSSPLYATTQTGQRKAPLLNLLNINYLLVVVSKHYPLIFITFITYLFTYLLRIYTYIILMLILLSPSCEKKGLSKTGKKADLVARLMKGIPVYVPPGHDEVTYEWDPSSSAKKKKYLLEKSKSGKGNCIRCCQVLISAYT